MKDLLKITVALLITNVCVSQTTTTKGDALRQEGKLEAAIEAYKATFEESPGNKENTYNLACAYALTYQKDSAYHYLNIALKNDHSLWALADSDLYALTNDFRWKTIENDQLKKFQEHEGALKDPLYAKALLAMIMKDQALDYYIKQARGFYMEQGYIPQWYYPLSEKKQQLVTDNYSAMQSLLKEHGWPKYSTVGTLAADAPLLVINHHESDEVRKTYLPQIKRSCLEKEGSCMEFAKIQDRILVNDNLPQMYGMQFRYNAERKLEPFPIKDPEYVDQRRKEIGLEPLKVYLKRKIDYDWTLAQKTKTD